MKKFKNISLCLMLGIATISLSGCVMDGLNFAGNPRQTEEHQHIFDVKIPSPETFCSEATCVTPPTYYVTCECGAIDYSATYESGFALGHDFKEENYHSNNDATHSHDGTKTCKCSRCDETNTVVDVGSRFNAPHQFREVVDDDFLAFPATCITPAKYYKSCQCGEMSTETFESGSPSGHNFPLENYYSNHDATDTSYGTKSCQCTRCGEIDTKIDYDSIDHVTHHIFEPFVDDRYLASEATCSEAAKYYYSCRCGKMSTDTFYYGNPVDHSFVWCDFPVDNEYYSNAPTGVYVCEYCGNPMGESGIWSVDTGNIHYIGLANPAYNFIINQYGVLLDYTFYFDKTNKTLKNYQHSSISLFGEYNYEVIDYDWNGDTSSWVAKGGKDLYFNPDKTLASVMEFTILDGQIKPNFSVSYTYENGVRTEVHYIYYFSDTGLISSESIWPCIYGDTYKIVEISYSYSNDVIFKTETTNYFESNRQIGSLQYSYINYGDGFVFDSGLRLTFEYIDDYYSVVYTELCGRDEIFFYTEKKECYEDGIHCQYFHYYYLDNVWLPTYAVTYIINEYGEIRNLKEYIWDQSSSSWIPNN